MKNKYSHFYELPEALKARIERLAVPEIPDKWINQAVPALSGKSILQILNARNGETKVDAHLTSIEGYLGG